jgi:hypothetical protein
LRVGQIPADHFRHVVDVAARDREAQRVLEEQSRFFPDAQRQIGERLPDRMQIGFAFDAADRKTVTASLGHVDVHGDLPQSALDHEALEEFRVFDQGLPVCHQHWDGADGNRITNDLDQFVAAA